MKTAVEWFLTEFQKQVWFEANSELDIWVKDLIPKAKEMEKEQIKDAHKHGKIWSESSEQYYNENFKSE
jgi:hypothetical protein